MPDRVASYGHTYQKAVVLSGMADREITRQRKGPRTDTPEPLSQNRYRTLFRNDNSGTCPKYGVLRITGSTTVDSQVYLTIDQPDSTYRWVYLVNGDEDVETGKYGCGTFLWYADKVLYGTGTPALGDEWGPTPSAWTLTRYSPGFFVFGGNDTTAKTTTAIQRLPSEVLVKNGTGGSYAAGHTGDTYQVFGGPEGSETNSNMTLVCCNRSTTAFGAGKYGAAARLGGGNYAVPFQQ